MKAVSPTLEQLKYLREVVKDEKSPTIYELKKQIAWSYKNAEKLAVLFGVIDESAVQEVVRLKLKLDRAYCDHLIDLGAPVREYSN